MSTHAEIRCRPIDRWDGDRLPDYWAGRRRAPFKAAWSTITEDLTRELEALDAHDVVLGLGLRPSDIRVDGWPRANAAIPPAVVLTFESKHGAQRYQCDRWDWWQHNVRAIGLTLWRLRLVDECGVATSGEQYRGWSELPAARPAGPAMTAEEAARLLLRTGNAHGWAATPATVANVIDTPELARKLYRNAARTRHPDAGGDPEEFRRLTAARDLLCPPVEQDTVA
jgi:hypothetical protein